MKFFSTLLVALFVFSLPSNAQTAKVIALSPADTDEVKAAYAARDAANKHLEDVKQKITDKYLMESKPGSGGFVVGNLNIFAGSVLCISGSSGSVGCGKPETAEEKKKREDDYKAYQEAEKKKTHLERKEGWSAFEYTEDFKYIVPTPITYNTRNSCGPFGVLTGSN